MNKSRISHNVGLLTSIQGDVQRYKGQLVIPCSCLGHGFDNMPGGGHNKQGGIVFDNDELALELLNKLQVHFDNHKITLSKEIYSWVWKLYKSTVLHIRVRVWFIRRKWKKEKAHT